MISKREIKILANEHYKKIENKTTVWISRICFIKGFCMCYKLMKKGNLREIYN